MSKLCAGIVRLTLCGEDFEMSATSRAIMRISDEFGGITGALTQVQKVDFRAAVKIIKYGLNADDALAKRLDDLVFAEGIMNQIAPLTRFLMLLANGGREPKGEDDKGDEGNGKAATNAA